MTRSQLERWTPIFLVLSLLLAGCGRPKEALKTAPHPEPYPHRMSAKPSMHLAFSPGRVLILEYHNFLPREGRWARTPAGFRRDLSRLYALGFRPVNLRDLVANRPDIPVGTHPVVLTFDDGDPSQFQFGPDGEPSATSAVGILLAFHRRHPDWGLRGTFFINNNPFGTDSAAKVSFLLHHGFEIGNHTLDHRDVGKLSPAEIEREIGLLQKKIAAWGNGYRPVSFALPYGGLPTDAAARRALLDGSYDGASWHFEDVVLVGAGPAPSPADPSFNPDALPRIQVASPATASPADRPFLLDSWLSWAKTHPGQLATVVQSSAQSPDKQ